MPKQIWALARPLPLIILVFLSSAVAAEKGPRCAPCATSKDGYGAEICPLWELEYLEDDTILYFAYRYQPNCNSTPTADYIIGNYTLPTTCGIDCALATTKIADTDDPHTNDAKDQLPLYTGFHGKKNINFMGEDTAGTPNRFRQVRVDDRIPYVKKPDADVYAKVLMYDVQIGKRMKPSTAYQYVFYVAYELMGPPSEFNDRLTWTEFPGARAYHTMFTPSDGNPIPILILMSDR